MHRGDPHAAAPRPSPTTEYAARFELLNAFITWLFDESASGLYEAMVHAIVQDGWPEPMARAGLRLHQKTWQIDVLCRGVEAEITALGGLAALEGEASELVIVKPKIIAHIWPALPGAGLVPVLYGALLGVDQWIRPSRRGRHFADFILANWPRDPVLNTLELPTPHDAWHRADVVVVSGSDDTIAQVDRLVRERFEEVRSEIPRRSMPVVTGYGHRTSFAVVVDGEGIDLTQLATDIARDAVMWHQRGCFSPLAVVFCGESSSMDLFAAELGRAIECVEHEWQAAKLSPAEAARRAQARGVAEFTTQTWGNGTGWVQLAQGPHRGIPTSPHTLTLHRVSSLGELIDAIDIPPHQIQGVALAAPADEYSDWAHALAHAGATRICAPGDLQAPPADWPHDGRPNILGWLRATRVG